MGRSSCSNVAWRHYCGLVLDNEVDGTKKRPLGWELRRAA
jgi:hypothetical protein